ncbi:MAG: VOC family protein [Rubrobacter sp.]|nr:VOC family protein [Rubrobacter sp.]MBA3950598.1 VOC family protein [Rubrobacter sp.]MDQ3378513.1 VOC family protein [Actinomycetota bacterium]
MPTRLDHLVILVRDLEEAVGDYGLLGFRVTPGGEHADGLTRNALVPFRDGTYLELVAFIEPEGGRDNVWGWREFLPNEGLIDYCAASDGLREDVERLRRLGFEVEGPSEGGRRLPDGQEIRWRSASIGQEGRVLPFLIEDVTPRERRVPGGPAADHPNGATGIPRLEISTPEAARTSEFLAALAGTAPGPLEFGACEIFPVEPGGERREGPSAVGLSTDAPGGGELDRTLSHGVRLALTRDEA